LSYIWFVFCRKMVGPRGDEPLTVPLSERTVQIYRL
jgi:hypothetical protein